MLACDTNELIATGIEVAEEEDMDRNPVLLYGPEFEEFS